MGRQKGGRRKQTHILYLSTAIAQMNFKLSTAHNATDQIANLPHSFHQRESRGWIRQPTLQSDIFEANFSYTSIFQGDATKFHFFVATLFLKSLLLVLHHGWWKFHTGEGQCYVQSLNSFPLETDMFLVMGGSFCIHIKLLTY